MEPQFFEFTVKELIALLGITQSVYYLVYISLRADRIARSSVPILFFVFIATAFLLSFAQRRWDNVFDYYHILDLAVWAMLLPLNILLILQTLFITKAVPIKYYGLVAIVPFCWGLAYLLNHYAGYDERLYDLMTIFVGVVSLSLMWKYRQAINDVRHHKNGNERYWLIISFLFLTIGLTALSFFRMNEFLNLKEFYSIRLLLGLSFLYIAGTCLFRLYPYAMPVQPPKERAKDFLSDEELEIALKIEDLLNFEKIYQEQNYNRASLAKELNISESALSKIINLHFKETIPQLLNRFRVKEAKLLLKKSDLDVTVISEDVGFNSIASFNRVFKDLEGVSPSIYRERLGSKK